MFSWRNALNDLGSTAYPQSSCIEVMWSRGSRVNQVSVRPLTLGKLMAIVAAVALVLAALKSGDFALLVSKWGSYFLTTAVAGVVVGGVSALIAILAGNIAYRMARLASNLSGIGVSQPSGQTCANVRTVATERTIETTDDRSAVRRVRAKVRRILSDDAWRLLAGLGTFLKGIWTSLTWTTMGAPPWFRIMIAWCFAETAVPFTQLIVSGCVMFDTRADPARHSGWLVWILSTCLLACSAVLLKALFDTAQRYLAPTFAAALSTVLLMVNIYVYLIFAARI